MLIVHNDASDRSLMPWIIASQTVPILAIAPMVVVGLNAVGVTGLVPKALISTYLSFFPVVVGMVKGLRSPEQIQLDLMRTYNASPWQVFAKLRWPAAMPFLFASMKVGIAISLSARWSASSANNAGGGLGARLLTGSYNGQTVQIWAALFLAAALAAVLVIAVGLAERLVNRAMGARRMSRLQAILAGLAGGAALAALGLFAASMAACRRCFLVVAALGALTLLRFVIPVPLWVDGGSPSLGAVALIRLLPVYRCRADVLLARPASRPGPLPGCSSSGCRRRSAAARSPGSAVALADPGGVRR